MILGPIDILGYAASGLTLATFAERTMLPMRLMTIGANLCFIGYGATSRFMPVLALHVVFLPINLTRLRALMREPGCEADRLPETAINGSDMAGTSSGLF